MDSKHSIFSHDLPLNQNTVDILQDLQSTFQLLDSSFTFTWDSELVFQFTSKFLKQISDKLFLQNSQNLQKSHQNPEDIQTLEKKLQTKEKLLKTEKIELDLQRQELEDEKHLILTEKESIKTSFQKLQQEKEIIQSQLEELNEKYSQIKTLVQEMKKPADPEDQAFKFNQLQQERENFEQEKARQMSQFLKLEKNMRERDENLEKKTKSLQVLAESLNKLKNDLEIQHQKANEEMESQFEKLKEQEIQFREKINKVDATLEVLISELAQVENIKSSLESSRKSDEICSENEMKEKFEEIGKRKKELQLMVKELNRG
jgi:chromosome segregation ATPase